MKATRILLISGIALLLAVFAVGIYIVPKAQSGSPATARQSDASRVSLSDVYLDVTYATPAFVQRVKLEPYLKQWQGRAQPFLVGINTHVGTIAELDLRGRILLEANNGDRFPSLHAVVLSSITTCISSSSRWWIIRDGPSSRRNAAFSARRERRARRRNASLNGSCRW